MKITITNNEVRTISAYMNGESYCFDSKRNTVKPAVSWPMFKNREAIKNLSEKIDKAMDEIRSKYNNDDMAHDVMDENGEVAGREVNEEFMPQFIQEMEELAIQENEVEIQEIPLSKLDDYEIDDKDFAQIHYFIKNDAE